MLPMLDRDRLPSGLVLLTALLACLPDAHGDGEISIYPDPAAPAIEIAWHNTSPPPASHGTAGAPTLLSSTATASTTSAGTRTMPHAAAAWTTWKTVIVAVSIAAGSVFLLAGLARVAARRILGGENAAGQIRELRMTDDERAAFSQDAMEQYVRTRNAGVLHNMLELATRQEFVPGILLSFEAFVRSLYDDEHDDDDTRTRWGAEYFTLLARASVPLAEGFSGALLGVPREIPPRVRDFVTQYSDLLV